MTKKKLLKIVTEFREGVLDGRSSARMCYAVCAPLCGYLRAVLDYDTRIVEGVMAFKDGAVTALMNHYWLALPDGTIIDPTADQFSTDERPMPPVYIGPQPEWYKVAENAATR